MDDDGKDEVLICVCRQHQLPSVRRSTDGNIQQLDARMEPDVNGLAPDSMHWVRWGSCTQRPFVRLVLRTVPAGPFKQGYLAVARALQSQCSTATGTTLDGLDWTGLGLWTCPSSPGTQRRGTGLALASLHWMRMLCRRSRQNPAAT